MGEGGYLFNEPITIVFCKVSLTLAQQNHNIGLKLKSLSNQCSGSGFESVKSALFWLPGVKSAKICGPSDPHPRDKISIKNWKQKSRFWIHIKIKWILSTGKKISWQNYIHILSLQVFSLLYPSISMYHQVFPHIQYPYLCCISLVFCWKHSSIVGFCFERHHCSLKI